MGWHFQFQLAIFLISCLWGNICKLTGRAKAIKRQGGQIEERLFICLEGNSMTLHLGSTFLFCFLQKLPCCGLGTLKGFLS